MLVLGKVAERKSSQKVVYRDNRESLQRQLIVLKPYNIKRKHKKQR